MTLHRRVTLLAACLVCSAPAAAAEVTGYAVLTSDYVFRGVTYSDSHAALQAGIDVTLQSGVYAGVWASTVDIYSGLTGRDREVDYYAGYSYDLDDAWTIGINGVAHSFPGTDGPIDYDYAELSAVVNFRDRAWLEYSYSPDIFHTSRHTHNVEIYGEWPLSTTLLVGAGAGYYDVAELAGAGYAYWQLGIMRPFRHCALDLRLHGTERAVPIVSSPERSRSRLVLSLQVPFPIAGN